MQQSNCVQIVDDDPSIRESLKSLLIHAGYTVYCYASAETFLANGASRAGCALVDLRLQGMDGISLQQKLLEQNSPVAVIMLSAYGDVENAVKAMRLGAVDFIEKPFDPEQLLTRVGKMMAARADQDSYYGKALRQAARVDTLSPREKQVMRLVVDGLSNKQVARALCLSHRTVETHRANIMQKLDAASLPDLVRCWLAAGGHARGHAS